MTEEVSRDSSLGVEGAALGEVGVVLPEEATELVSENVAGDERGLARATHCMLLGRPGRSTAYAGPAPGAHQRALGGGGSMSLVLDG